MIAITNLTVAYGDKTVLNDLSFKVARGAFVSLLGPSGCGKSTLLRTIGGFVTARSGAIVIAGRDVTRLDPEQRKIGFVFQSYALFAHMTVAENVEFGLKAQRVGSAERAARVKEVLETTGLSEYRDASPATLSGGQQQRVAIARVLATRPSVLLMDEPLSNLDTKLRVRLCDELRHLHRQLGITTLYVTHDRDEALSLSDRVAVMKDGRFEQLAAPLMIYDQPSTSYVCDFVGEANVFSDSLAARFGLALVADRRLHVRAERLRLGPAADDAYNTEARVELVTFLGSVIRYSLAIDSERLTAVSLSDGSDPYRVGDRVTCSFSERDALWLR